MVHVITVQDGAAVEAGQVIANGIRILILLSQKLQDVLNLLI